jgi:signal transduction histidine kinase
MLFVGMYVVGLPAQDASRYDEDGISSLKELQNIVTASGRTIASFRVEGLVCAVSAKKGAIVIQDASATVLLELPDSVSQAKVGDGIVIEGRKCTLTRGSFGIQVGTAPVVDIDGRHDAVRKSGKVFLEEGPVPLRVEWFVGGGRALLEMEYEGPGVSRQPIPATALRSRVVAGANSTTPDPGLEFTNYIGDGWNALPDFKKLTPSSIGRTGNFDVSQRTRPRDAAMVFAGYLQITNAGVYTFYVDSHDGARVYVGVPAAQCVVSQSTNQSKTVNIKNLSQAIIEGGDQQWAYLDGRVISVRERTGLTELEVSFGQRPVFVTVLNMTDPIPSHLRGASVRVTGIYQPTWGANESWAAWLVVPGPEQLVIKDASQPMAEGATLTTVGQIRALSPDAARKHVPVTIRGIVTTANYWSCILQDASGGIYLPYSDDDWVNQPRPGEVWEFEGVTDAGDFSPIVNPSRGVCLGNAALPEGIRPAWSELMDGSVDAEQVEIEAAVISQSGEEMTLLTHDGKVSLLVDDFHPLPSGPSAKKGGSLVGSVVRLRGVFLAEWDTYTHLVKPGVFRLGNAMVSVVEPMPTNVFGGPTKKVVDLLKFKSQAEAFRRVRVEGVVLDSQPGEYILSDNSGSIRVLAKEPEPLQEGDLVEAVGFAQLGGPSPVLLEARMRQTGKALRPKPVQLSVQELPDVQHDAMLVRIDAMLLSDSLQKNERVLELQSGPIHFLAKLRPRAATVPPIRPGSRLLLTGVYSSTRGYQVDKNLDAFELLVNEPADIYILQQGPWWTVQRAIGLIVLLGGSLIASLAWVGSLRQTVMRRTLQLKREIETRQLVEQRRALEQERARVAHDLHDELGAGLTEVSMLGALANNPAIDREKQDGYLNRLTVLARQLVAGLDEIVWVINPKHDNNASLSGYLCDYAQEFLSPTRIACRFDVAKNLPDRGLNAHRRHQLFIAFKESLTNVVKHARASEVWVRIGGDERELWIAVEDNGRGLEPNAARPNADGLFNMRQRMTQIGGEFEIKDRPGGGTIARFSLFTNGEPQNL